MKKIVIKFTWMVLVAFSLFACEEDRMTEDSLITIPPVTENGDNLPDWVEKLTNPMIDWVKIYPGEVDAKEPRLQSVIVKMKPYYKKNAPSMSNNGGTPLFSTGYYAAPAEMITIVVPASLAGKTVNYVININPCNLDKPCTGGGAVAQQKRYSYVRKSGSLQVGENKVFNYFGGQIYLTFGQEILGEHEFEIRGAVKSPDFIEGDDIQEWKQMLDSTKVPYGEIRSKKYILTLSLKHLKNIPDPQAVCDFYNEFVKICYNDFFGFVEDEAQPCVVPDNMRAVMTPWRSFCDYQMCGGAAHSGYPTAFGQSYEPRMAKLEELSRGGHWGLWHENGHNFQQSKWKWGSQGEVTCNINIFKWYYKKLGYWAEGSRLTTFQGVVANYVAKDIPNKDFEKRSTDEHICPYIQLAYGLGWGVYKYLGIQNRTNTDYDNTEPGKKDFFAKRVSEYAGANMMPFFDDWGIAVSRSARLYIEMFPDWSETERGKQMGEFWKHFNYGPVTDPEQHDDYRAPDPNTFPKVDLGDIDRTNWALMSFEGTNVTGDKDVSGEPEKMIDGNGNTCALWVKPGVTYDGKKGIEPMQFVINMGKQESFGYFVLRNRTVNGNVAFNVQKISLWGSNDGTTFTPIQEDITVDHSQTENKIYLSKTVKYQYVKVKITGWMIGGGRSCIAVGEFKLGL